MQDTDQRLRITVHGLVQGVGYRPYVQRLASSLNLSGFVLNTGKAVEIEVQGQEHQVGSFLKLLSEEKPPHARVEKLVSETTELVSKADGFQIKESTNTPEKDSMVPFVSPDLATCPDCLKELFSKHDRRFKYPFINCTNCGPRFTIIKALPYDRASTTMRSFVMCKDCNREYLDPQDRRFHAQPNACKICGPELSFVTRTDTAKGQQALDETIDSLVNGQVIAVKGIGGYHLMGDATKADVVKTIRTLKKRDDEPFAVMLKDMEEVNKQFQPSLEESEILTGCERPIVLLKNNKKNLLAENVAARLDEVGVILPYTPLHHLIMQSINFPLIVTSLNRRGEPIITEDKNAKDEYLDRIAGVLTNNRDIYSGYDDSVVRIVAEDHFVVRRARGLAPAQLQLPFDTTKSGLAVGANLKSTFCLSKGQEARVSQHLGNLSTFERMENFESTLISYQNIFDIKPEIIARDLHPDYQSSIFAEKLAANLGIEICAVQHHHAHAVSVMAENKIPECLAVVFDGTGLGTDGNVWGGEFLLATYKDFQRLAHLEYVPMPGSEKAITHPWRMALGFLDKLKQRTDISSFANFHSKLEEYFGESEIALVETQIEKRLNTPLTSSCGRLFDAVAAILNPQLPPTYEGQAPMELEALARQCTCRKRHRLSVDIELRRHDDVSSINSSLLLLRAQEEFVAGMPSSCVARAFHDSVCELILQTISALNGQVRQKQVCLAGGVFQNTLLLTQVKEGLERQGLKVILPKDLPFNDGAISFGQVVSALARSTCEA